MNSNVDINNNSTDSVSSKIGLFLLSPILSFIHSLRDINKNSSYLVIFLFSVYFGICFTVGTDRTVGSNDGIYWRTVFETYQGYSLNSFLPELREYFSFDSDYKDFFVESLSFIIGRFTDNYHYFFMIFAVIFAVFQLKSLRFFTENINFTRSFFCYCLLFFFSWNQICNINGCRFWTSAWISIYIAFQVFKNNKRKYLLLSLILPFIHGSFWIIVILYGITYLSCQYDKIWTLIFCLSFVFSSLTLGIMQDNASYLPSFLSHYLYYIEEDNLQRVGAYYGGRTIFENAITIFSNVLILVIVFIRNKELDVDYKRILVFTLALLSFANFTMPIPSVGNRFLLVSYPLIAYCYLVYCPNGNFQKLAYLIPLLFLYRIYDIIDFYLLIINPIDVIITPIFGIIKHLVLSL